MKRKAALDVPEEMKSASDPGDLGLLPLYPPKKSLHRYIPGQRPFSVYRH